VPRVLFGRGAIDRVGPEAATLGQRVLFVCTPSLKASTHAMRVRASLGDRLVAEFADVEPHVPVETVNAARALADQKQVDVIVAMGGGSAMGVGKGVVVADERSLIAIPTTYAGSEMTPVFGSTNRAEGRKSVRRDPAVLPKLVIYDPEVTLDLSPELTASTAMNALAHCVEACYARDVNPLVPPVALEGIRRIVRSLPLCVTNGRNLDAREDLLRGAYLAGFSIGNATMALHHGICHVLGGRTGVAHGVLNAIMLPHVMRFNADAVPDAMGAIADVMRDAAPTMPSPASGGGEEVNPPSAASGGGEQAAEVVAALVASLPVPQRLRDAGVQEAVLDSVAVEAAGNSTVQANPKPVTEADLVALLRSAW
jgi:maleylacetate reductase